VAFGWAAVACTNCYSDQSNCDRYEIFRDDEWADQSELPRRLILTNFGKTHRIPPDIARVARSDRACRVSLGPFGF